jgi:hypothetical protein
MSITFAVRGEFIQLDQLLKATGLCESGGAAHAPRLPKGGCGWMLRSTRENGRKFARGRRSVLPVRSLKWWPSWTLQSSQRIGEASSGR